MMNRNIEREAAELLLDAGVSLPLLKTFGKTLRVTMRRPTLGGIVRITREQMKLGVTSAQIALFTESETQHFLAEHGKTLARIIALTVCRGWLSGLVIAPLLARAILWWMPYEHLLTAQIVFIKYLSEVRNFQPIISCIEQVNPLRAKQSREKTLVKRS